MLQIYNGKLQKVEHWKIKELWKKLCGLILCGRTTIPCQNCGKGTSSKYKLCRNCVAPTRQAAYRERKLKDILEK